MLTTPISTAYDLVLAGILAVPGAQFRRAHARAIASAQPTDLYTCPSGKRAYVPRWTVVSQGSSSSAATIYAYWSGAYYQLIPPTAAIGANNERRAAGATFQNGGIILDAGERYAMQASVADCLLGSAFVIEFPAAYRCFTQKSLSLSVGNFALYTCPANYSAIILDGTLSPGFTKATAFSVSVQSLMIGNFSGGTANVNAHLVPSGLVPITAIDGTGNQLYPLTSVATGLVGPYAGAPFATLGPGDFLNVYTDRAGVYAWVNILEIPDQ